MAILKCKMCGGDLEVQEGMTVCECEYCGSKQTVPSVDDEKKITLFTRANRLRAACEFDKAAGVYESIVSEFQEEAEAYWGLVLCKYGIEYVDDPASGNKIPTCHRSSFDSVMKDDDFEQVMELSDSLSRSVYREEAKSIEELRKGIIEISGKEEPYDIFICYKETDENGKRTIDSVIAQDVYDELVNKGYRVFFSRISLEDKLGQEYEPYIFAALNSAKLMLAFGTSYDYYNAVWVKNEWSRFLKIMAKGKGKYLIPCYKDLDAYDIPEEFSRFQAQDMGKVGATQDLMRGIEKLLGGKKDDKNSSDSKQTVIVNSNNPSVESLLKRVEIFLSDSDWKSADEYCEKVLDIEPENATAYLGKLCSKFQVESIDSLVNNLSSLITSNGNYKKAIKFAGIELKEKLEAIALAQKKNIDEAEEKKRKERIYVEAEAKYSKIINSSQAEAIIPLYEQILGYKDADEKLIACKNYDKEEKYKKAVRLYKKAASLKNFDKVIEILEGLAGYKDSLDILEKVKASRKKVQEEETSIIASAEEVYRQYSLRIEKNKGVSKETRLEDMESQIEKLKKEISDLEQKMPQVTAGFARLTELNNFHKQETENIDSLIQRKGSLGFFAGKEKKAIDEQVAQLRVRINSLDIEMEGLRQSVSPYRDVNEVQQKLMDKRNQLNSLLEAITILKDEIIQEKSNSSELWDEEKLYTMLLRNNILFYIMRDGDKCKVVEKDKRVADYIKKNPVKNPFANGETIVLRPELSGEELTKIEKLNYWELDPVKETKEELKERIVELIENFELLIDYDVKADISPASLDAASIIEKHYDDEYKNWYEENHDDKYDPNTYARPIDLILEKNGKPMLVIMLYWYKGNVEHSYYSNYRKQTVTYTTTDQEGVISLGSAPLSGWIAHWCNDNKVPHLNFYAGMPNEAHYILRRICEVLGEVKSNGYNNRYRGF